ncbi:glycosyltransferase family 2 protein [Sporosarcina newyorkensis]|uniref:Glycosyltransferase involved in cell wall bisynthesis n=1 Tax=Sporosarcina newyorkensis TaxID=759851 RepID=A0A1T4YW93_9BACL|nr:glycosyltransferase family 2 protein [Sporosarcina newyorkensis]SKB05903.1 Glycosyltransferase involved in cell wall bisynthesis [Sporosarcina newyorkensis]
MENNPIISLCMIVKDEEERIETCLKSASSIADEVIIVDTGSTDQTIKLCQQFENVKILHYDWDQHFANARNFGIDHARGEWILWLDADEELDVPSWETVKEQLAQQEEATVIQLPVFNYVGERLPIQPEQVFIYYQPRLFRNSKGYQFLKRIHETLKLPTDANITYLPSKIHHYGYITEIEKKKKKETRNIELLQIDIDKMAEDPWVAYHLASEYYRRQEYTQAFQYINLSIYYFLQKLIKPPSILYRLKYAILIETKSLDGAWPSIEKAIDLYPDYVDLHFFKGYILFEKERYKEALEAFGRCLELGDDHKEHLIWQGTGSYRAMEYKGKCLKKIDQGLYDKGGKI